ncbi:CLUMA_CG008787, isoform A [Clunio marinus]|uniref:CLUMA_CG008787, isoform A n=1 Tax=Clunio marinus TaxID=568069 RepID=A0A1J1I6L5_9DIPT|nr:CLUMA_CG008787, isoform A [Clunio marinus]
MPLKSHNVKHQARTLRQKLLIVDKLKKSGDSISDVMKEFNMKQSTVSTIIENEIDLTITNDCLDVLEENLTTIRKYHYDLILSFT